MAKNKMKCILEKRVLKFGVLSSTHVSLQWRILQVHIFRVS